ncbi:ankyrin repeat domain-containing protein SOWAHB-like isoform X1 [Lates japonicus]|uniref:Ankyrin repeat domain-containing protein SOWAHB-like isoform X1 n=1 Tax=Lates japonicus TaxID=270547 RepID=A0AAD3MZ03_LATJO|nr:ankyrin repeat domain-containing protein SOWAHB-like isoform X1 [Lates japonicus]
MEEGFQKSPVDEELHCSNTEVTQEEEDVDPPQDQELDRIVQDQNQSPESFRQDQEQLSLHSDLDRADVQDEEVKGQTTCHPDPPEEQTEVQELNQDPSEVHDGRECGGVLTEEETQESDRHHHHHHQDLFGAEQIQDQSQTADVDRAEHQSVHHSDQDQDQDQDQDLTPAAANQDEAGESGGSVPALVITQAEEYRSASAAAAEPPLSPEEPAEPQRPERPADLPIPAAVNMFTDPSLSSSSDGGDTTCCDLLSLRSDSLSLASEPTNSRRSDPDSSSASEGVFTEGSLGGIWSPSNERRGCGVIIIPLTSGDPREL